MKDMNSKQDLYRANAIRVLCKIIDSSLLTQIERYLKQAVVDKNSVVASSALVRRIFHSPPSVARACKLPARWLGYIVPLSARESATPA